MELIYKNTFHNFYINKKFEWTKPGQPPKKILYTKKMYTLFKETKNRKIGSTIYYKKDGKETKVDTDIARCQINIK